MRNLIRRLIMLGALGCCLATGWAAGANGPLAEPVPTAEVGVQYNYVHTNAPPGGCGCFSMDGGGGWFALNVTKHWAAVADVSAQHASDINGSGLDLTLTSYVAGPRYRLGQFGRVAPFVQALFGGAHASGSLAPGTGGNPGSPDAFAMIAGGGLDVVLGKHLALRAPEVDYFLTNFVNTVNDHQNNLRVSAGVVFRFGER